MKRLAFILVLVASTALGQVPTSIQTVSKDLSLLQRLIFKVTTVGATSSITALSSSTSYIRLTGSPGGTFTLKGIIPTNDGTIIIVVNGTDETMLVSPENTDASVSYRILGDSTASIIKGRAGFFIYSSTVQRWSLFGGSSSGGIGTGTTMTSQEILDSLNAGITKIFTGAWTFSSDASFSRGVTIGSQNVLSGVINLVHSTNGFKIILKPVVPNADYTLWLPARNDTVATIGKLGNFTLSKTVPTDATVLYFDGVSWSPLSTSGFSSQIATDGYTSTPILQATQNSTGPIFLAKSGSDTALVVFANKETFAQGLTIGDTLWFRASGTQGGFITTKDDVDSTTIFLYGSSRTGVTHKFKGAVEIEGINVLGGIDAVMTRVDTLLTSNLADQKRPTPETDNQELRWEEAYGAWVNRDETLMRKLVDDTGTEGFVGDGAPVLSSAQNSFKIAKMLPMNIPPTGEGWWKLIVNGDSISYVRDTTSFLIVVSDEGSTLTTGIKQTLPCPYTGTLVSIEAFTSTNAGGTDSTVIDLKVAARTANWATYGASTTVFTGAPSYQGAAILGTYWTSLANPYQRPITTTALKQGDKLTVEITKVASGAKGAKLILRIVR